MSREGSSQTKKNANGRKKKTEKNKKRSKRKAEKRKRSTKKLSEIRLESVQIVGNKGTQAHVHRKLPETPTKPTNPKGSPGRRENSNVFKGKKLKLEAGQASLRYSESRKRKRQRQKQKKKEQGRGGNALEGREGARRGTCKAGQSPFQNLPQC